MYLQSTCNPINARVRQKGEQSRKLLWFLRESARWSHAHVPMPWKFVGIRLHYLGTYFNVTFALGIFIYFLSAPDMYYN